ncbi:MAG TPA: class I SAM-dependent methyltransferase, partial [Pyrinomonadaceae bacterium]|nr:class I SAM-dependent methyltransferase [Pyrinomonadaceae bacterium]
MKYLDLFDRDFSQGLGVRARSFRQVFELLEALHSPPYTIVETGVTNLPVPPLPWKAPSPHGHSSVLFQHFLNHHGGRLYSVDINPEHCAVALEYADNHVEIVCADSRRFLHQRRFQSPINCLYLDSLEIDWGNPHL